MECRWSFVSSHKFKIFKKRLYTFNIEDFCVSGIPYVSTMMRFQVFGSFHMRMLALCVKLREYGGALYTQSDFHVLSYMVNVLKFRFG